MKKNDKGSLVISLDFEMMWGCHDWATIDGYGKSNIINVRNVIKRLLALFEKYGIHATFASVGMLMLDGKDELLSSIPDKLPSYNNRCMSPYKEGYIDNISKDDEGLFFAPDIIGDLKRHPGIEIGTHTFCHYYCWEDGQTVAQFECDIKNAVEIAKRNGIHVNSIVFPKNNVSGEYLKVVAKYGIKIYRGNPRRFFKKSSNIVGNITQRVLRLLDNYIPLAKNTYSYLNIRPTNDVVNIPASRFLRPYNSKLRWFEKIRVARIKKEILAAARNQEIYHLWWHPHNFGNNIDENFSMLEDILRIYSECSDKYGMMSLTMSELSDYTKLNS